MLKHLQDVILNIELGKYLVSEYGDEVKKLYYDKKILGDNEWAKIAEYMKKMNKVINTIRNIENDMNKLAKVYNPRYIEYLGFASNTIYRSLIDSFNRQLKTDEKNINVENRIEEAVKGIATTGTLRRYLEDYTKSMISIIPTVQPYEQFLKHLESLRKKKKEEKKEQPPEIPPPAIKPITPPKQERREEERQIEQQQAEAKEEKQKEKRKEEKQQEAKQEQQIEEKQITKQSEAKRSQKIE